MLDERQKKKNASTESSFAWELIPFATIWASRSWTWLSQNTTDIGQMAGPQHP